MKTSNPLLLPLALALLGVSATAWGKTLNGNDFALYFSEAKDDRDRESLLEEARGNPHFFRYLQIMEMEEAEEDGQPVVRIVAFEPASLLDVKFTLTKQVSLSVLKEDPVSKIGDALAVTGVVLGVSETDNAIVLGQTIIRHKDRLSPKMGKELLGEVKPGAIFYSYTAGPRPVNLSYRDRDLLKFKDEILEKKGPAGWVEFLEKEVAKRKTEREAKKD